MNLGLHRIHLRFFLLILFGIFISINFLTHDAHANYVGNNLIDNSIYLNSTSMNQSQVQSFLSARGGYIASYSAYSSRDNATISAAQIIYEAAQDYGINPQVILATLQKEQSLVTDPSPVSSQINYAMGYGCYDATGCSGNYGFANQVMNATWQLRFNYERASGNNSWWNSSIGYACNGTTRYYSAALKPGNNVIFYDDYGTAYTQFTINNAATASLYCYTPHAYPGSSAQYYSGSYNFVTAFEQWFGSTQPSITVTSSLRIDTAMGSIYSGAPTTISFDLANSTNNTITVNIAATVRGTGGTNFDYALKAITVTPHGTITYSDTKTLPNEGQYTFGITSFTNGLWNDNYPVSSNIDNPRLISTNVQAVPTITVSPSTVIGDMRVGRQSGVSFTVKNNSAQSINIGNVALAMRDPNGMNVDLPLVNTGVIAAGSQYVYSQLMTPSKVGTYTGFVVAATSDGSVWSNTFPATTGNTISTIQFSVQPNPTLTSGPTFNIANPKSGQTVTMNFKVKNYGEATVDAGYVGIAVRDPDNQNVDIGGVTLNALAGSSEYTFSGSRIFTKPGTYTAWIVSYKNNVWADDVPVSDSAMVQRKVTFTVSPSPTLTQGLTITSGASLYAGDTVAGTFKVKNYGDIAVTVNKSLCYIIRGGPAGSNNDLGCLTIGTLAPGQGLTFTGSHTIATAGQYKGFFSMYDGTWHDNWSFDKDIGTEPTTVSFTVKSNPVLTQGLTLDNTTPRVGDTVTGSFKVKNNSTRMVTVNKSLCYIMRSVNQINYDLGCLPIGTLSPGQELTFSAGRQILDTGQYKAYFSLFDGTYWYDNSSFDQATGAEPTTLQFNAKSTPTLTQGLTLNTTTPAVGSTIVGNFKIKNNGTTSVTVNKSLCYIIRGGPAGSNNDLGCLNIGTIAPGQELTFTGSHTIAAAGQYRGFFSMFDGTWHDNWSFDKDIGTEPTTVSFTAS